MQKKVDSLMDRVTKADQLCVEQDDTLRDHEEKVKSLEAQIQERNDRIERTIQVGNTHYTTVRGNTLLSNQLKFQLEEHQREADKLKDMTDTKKEIEQEKAEVQKLQDQCRTYRKRLEHYSKNGKGSDPFQEEQLNYYKKLVRCTVCDNRMKNCVLRQCFHVFCRECINTNLQTRKRKCPGCAKAFGESDVHNIFLM